jgi:leader peptidase (prepilin peptidase) / N-methyltransferase
VAIRTVPDAGSSHVDDGPITTDITVFGLLTALVAVLVATTQPSWTHLAAAFWIACAIVLSYSDATTHRLPLGLVFLMTAGTLVLLGGALSPAAFTRALLAGLGLGFVIFLLCLPRNGLSLGDAALGVPIGIALGWTGWASVALWLLTASLLLTITGTALLALGRVSRGSRLPLGPFLLLAVLPAVLLT